MYAFWTTEISLTLGEIILCALLAALGYGTARIGWQHYRDSQQKRISSKFPSYHELTNITENLKHVVKLLEWRVEDGSISLRGMLDFKHSIDTLPENTHRTLLSISAQVALNDLRNGSDEYDWLRKKLSEFAAELNVPLRAFGTGEEELEWLRIEHLRRQALALLKTTRQTVSKKEVILDWQGPSFDTKLEKIRALLAEVELPLSSIDTTDEELAQLSKDYHWNVAQRQANELRTTPNGYRWEHDVAELEDHLSKADRTRSDLGLSTIELERLKTAAYKSAATSEAENIRRTWNSSNRHPTELLRKILSKSGMRPAELGINELEIRYWGLNGSHR